MARRTLFALLAVAGLALVAAPSALADLADERALADRFAPVVRLVEQDEECGPGEPYDPLDVDLLLDGEPTVALRGPWRATDLVKIGPSAEDLRNRYEYHLDFPGDALNPGCDYERWSRRLAAGSEPTVYAHVGAEPGKPGKLALQYWFFYAFNDFNNTHEGDWEMIQLVFDADDAARGARAGPGRSRLQLARRGREGGLGRGQARRRRRDPPGRLPGCGIAREQVHRGPLSRQLRRGRGRLRRHARARTASCVRRS